MGQGHTHMFSEKSLAWLYDKFDFEVLTHWWFGSDAFDLHRSIDVHLRLDPKTAGRDPARAELAADCFNHLDRCVGDLIEYAESRDASVMIMSDHGHGSLDGKVQPNLLLRRWGYLGVNRARQIKTRASGIVNRWFSGGAGKFSRNRSIEDDLAIDWPTTRAVIALTPSNPSQPVVR